MLVQLICKEVKNRNGGKNVTQRALGEQALAVQEVDSAIHRKKHYPEDSSIGFRNIYPLDSGLSGE